MGFRIGWDSKVLGRERVAGNQLRLGESLSSAVGSRTGDEC